MKASIAFAAGVAIGGLVGWYISKQKYEEVAQREFNERRAALENERKKEHKSKDEKPSQIAEDYINPRKLAQQSLEKPSIMEYESTVNKAGYKDYTKGGEVVEKKVEEKEEGPYSIPRDQLGSMNYEHVILTLYSDHVLADDQDEEVDIASTVGEEFEDHIGQFEDNVAFIRNDKLQIDYEVYTDERSFKEVSGR